jgi:hypothetical protein
MTYPKFRFRRPETQYVYDSILAMTNSKRCQYQDREKGCGKTATRVRYNVSATGGIDRSSKTFRCSEHD